MRYIEKNISQFIESQFPALYREEGPILIEFIKSYFEWMENEGNTLYKTRRLLDYRDIDTTLDEYLEHFRDKYAQNLDLNTEADKRLLIKNIQDLYKSKGSERSYEILFRSIYNKDLRFYYPGDDILRVSDGEWHEGRYVEITVYAKNIQDFVGKEIRGFKSGASALVENFSQRVVNNKIIDVMEISHVKGSFDYGERIYPSNQVGNPIAQILLPRTVGSLTAIGVIDGGSNFDVGDILDVVGKGGRGKAKVTSTFTQQGRVTFNLENGGTGYSMNAVTQVFPQMQLTVNNVVGNFNVDQLLFQTDNANTMVANGVIMAANSTVITIKVHTPGFERNKDVRSAQKLILSPTSGTFANGERIYQANSTANVATGTIISIVPGVSNTAYYVANITGNFVQSVYDVGGNTFVVRGNTSGANGFLFETLGAPGTGVAAVANLVGGGIGATFRVGAIYDKEIMSINSDYIRNYVNTRLMLINEGAPLTGTVAVTNNQSNVVGTSTLFTSQVTVGGYIQVSNGSSKQIRQVNSVVNNTLLTITTTFANTQSGVNIYTDQINYMFPKVSSIADVENLGTILDNALTFNELEVGTIQYLSGINPGSGYSLDPYASVTEPLVAALEIPSPSGIKGADAVVSAKAGTANGIAMGVTVIDSGFGYEEGERLELIQSNSAFAITGSAIVTEHGKQAGYWKSTKGFLDSDKYIQDSKYYQQFSYEIQTALNFNSYKDVVKELLHTAGTEFFGKFYLNDIDLDANVSTDSIISNTDVVLPNNYPTIRPSFAMNNLRSNPSVPPQVSVVRATSASYFNANGVLTIAVPDEARFDYDPVTLEPRGYLVEETRINYAHNPRCEGANSNTNTMPTDWSVGGWAPLNNGVARQVVGSGYEDGIPYVDVRFSGLSTSGVSKDMFFLGSTTCAATIGDYFTGSVYLKLLSGTINGVSLVRFFTGKDSGGAGFSDQATNAISLESTRNIPFKQTRTFMTRTIASATTAYAIFGLRLQITSGSSVDFTIRFGAPQFEKAYFATTPILPPIGNSSLQTTRNGDTAIISNPVWSSNTDLQGTISVEYSYSNNWLSNTVPKLLWTLHTDATISNTLSLSIDQTDAKSMFSGRASSPEWSIKTVSAITSNTVNKTVCAWATNDIIMAHNGSIANTDTLATIPGSLILFKIGSNYANDGTRSFNGHIRNLEYYPSRLSNNQLIALSTL